MVQLKPDLCIVDYYGEEIRGKEYQCSTSRSESMLLENSMATATSIKDKGRSKVLVARESSEGSSAGSIDYDTDYNDYSEDDFEAAVADYEYTSTLGSACTFVRKTLRDIKKF